MFPVMFKTLFMFILVIVSMRLMGKRQLGQLEASDLVATIIISELAAMPIANEEMPLHHPVGAIAVILFVEIVMSLLALKSIHLRAVFGGKPSPLILNGKIQKEQMKRNRITVDELIEELRQKDVTDLNKVKHAVIERSGMLSVVQQESTLPVILISDGRVLKKNMRFCGVTEKYIEDELKNRGVSSVKDVFLLMLDEAHTFYLYTQMDVA